MRICWHPVTCTSVLQIRICDQPTINKKKWENSTLQVLCPHPVILFKISCTQSSLSTPWIIFHDFHTKKKREEEDLWSSPLNLTKTVAGAGLSLISGQLTMVAIHLKEHNPGRTLRKKMKTIRTSAWSATHAKIPLIFQTTHQAQPRHPKAWWEESAIAVSCYL